VRIGGKKVLLTRALGSLGRAQALRLAAAGARMFLLDRHVADLVMFLRASASDMITGQNIVIDGGR
jgi:NAD(P)-dependent dehydrogenase (short-subunit alcohol dehydrogenase family)